MKQSTEILKEGLKQENLLARDFEFAFYKKVSLAILWQDASIPPENTIYYCNAWFKHLHFVAQSCFFGSMRSPDGRSTGPLKVEKAC